MVSVIRALGQVVFNKVFAGLFVSQLQKRLPSGMTAMQTKSLQCVAHGRSTDKLTFHNFFFETSHRSTVSEFDSFLPKARDL